MPTEFIGRINPTLNGFCAALLTAPMTLLPWASLRECKQFVLSLGFPHTDEMSALFIQLRTRNCIVFSSTSYCVKLKMEKARLFIFITEEVLK